MFQVVVNDRIIGIITVLSMGCNNSDYPIQDWRLFLHSINSYEQVGIKSDTFEKIHIDDFKKLVEDNIMSLMDIVNDKHYSIKVTFNTGFSYYVYMDEWALSITNTLKTMSTEACTMFWDGLIHGKYKVHETSFPSKVVKYEKYQYMLDESNETVSTKIDEYIVE